LTPVAVDIIYRPMMQYILRAGATAAFVLAMAMVPSGPVNGQACTADQISAAVDQAGDALRAITQANQPRLEQRLKALKVRRGWTEAEAEDKAYAELADARTAELDQTANELLARIDQLGNLPANAVPECGRLQELEAASLELQATVKAKSAYMLSRLDSLIAGQTKATETAGVAVPVAPVTTAPLGRSTQAPNAAQPPATKPPAPPSRPWSTTTSVETQATVQPPVTPAPPAQPTASTPSIQPDDDGYTIDEIVGASTGLFGKVSAGLGSVVEHAFSKSGRPAGYILGTEGGGAFLAGLRYGSGTLYLRSGGTMPIHWHGPSLGADVGAQGARIMFLVYRMRDPDQLWASFTSVEGSAFLAGGLGFNLMTNGDVQMAPIRSGIGLRLGASIGYIRFTRRPTWNPF
jgi:hypothetical protein